MSGFPPSFPLFSSLVISSHQLIPLHSVLSLQGITVITICRFPVPRLALPAGEIVQSDTFFFLPLTKSAVNLLIDAERFPPVLFFLDFFWDPAGSPLELYIVLHSNGVVPAPLLPLLSVG